MQLSFDFYMIEAKPENLIGDQAYDSDALDESLKKQGVEMIAPHRSNRKRKTQDQRRLRRYERRWLVERYFAWLQWKRRLLVRWEYYAVNFLGFVQLANSGSLARYLAAPSEDRDVQRARGTGHFNGCMVYIGASNRNTKGKA